jgi:hypothetical protein
VFRNLLSEENVLIFGAYLINIIYQALRDDKSVFTLLSSFLPESTPINIKIIVFDILLSMYSHMQGKDFSMNLFSKNSCLKVTTRQVQAVLSNPAHYKKKKNDNDK